MTNQYDTIIIGAGHNGLVAAAYLAKKGKTVLVLERRDIVGGQVVTESFGEGFTVDSLHAGGTLRPDIIKDLKLSLPAVSARPAFISLQPDSNHLVLDPDPVKAAESIKRFSEKDAASWKPFLDFMDKASRFIHLANETIMPRLPKNFSFDEGMSTYGRSICTALRMRVNMSAIGSVIISRNSPANVCHGCSPRPPNDASTRTSPTGLFHPRNHAFVAQLAEADPAQLELAVHGARSAT